MCDSSRKQGASYLSELQVVFMEAEYCHLLFISLFILKMWLLELANKFGPMHIFMKQAWQAWCDGLIAVRAEAATWREFPPTWMWTSHILQAFEPQVLILRYMGDEPKRPSS